MAPRRRTPDAVIQALWAIADGASWSVAIVGTVWMRLGYDFHRTFVPGTWTVAAWAAVIHIVFGLLFGPYLVKHVRGSFDEVVSVARATFLTAVALAIWAIWIDPFIVPRSVPAVAGGVALILMLAWRSVVRSWRARAAIRRDVGANVIIYGAGVLGRRLLVNMVEDDQASFRPVAFLDDDRRKRKLRVEGVPVRGGRDAMMRVAKRYDATHLAVAIPLADASLMREIKDLAAKAHLTVKVLPTLNKLLDANPHVSDLRDINLEDLLGRRVTQLDQAAIADQITGKVVLVTGAGGSIGSELCRQIRRFHPDRLLLLDRDESALHATHLSLTGRGFRESEDLLLTDIRDANSVARVFERCRPDVVFHAAALKHLPFLERFPEEAWVVNVLGTYNVLNAAARSGVGTFVNVSTDKAANPTSILGYTKRTTERLTSFFAATEPGRYVSVRFGNVLGSRGSVVPLFTEQIQRGGPVTVTHPEVERYFMLIPEACELVMQAASMETDGDVLVLDMGTPVRITEVAETLIAMSGRRDIEITFTGLRPAEKMSEDLYGLDGRQATSHPLVRSVRVPALDPFSLKNVDPERGDELVGWLRQRSSPTESVITRA